MTAKYNLQFLFFISAKLFINFKGLNFQNNSVNLQGLALCKTPQGIAQRIG